MSKKIKIITAILVLGLIGAVGAYYYTFHMPHKNTFKIKPEFSLKAGKLYDDFDNDEDKANAKYLGKIIEVEGKVVGVNKFNDNYEISLKDDMEGITCLVDSNYAIQQKALLEKIKADDIIKIKGQCNGFLMGVKLDRCVVVPKQ